MNLSFMSLILNEHFIISVIAIENRRVTVDIFIDDKMMTCHFLLGQIKT